MAPIRKVLNALWLHSDRLTMGSDQRLAGGNEQPVPIGQISRSRICIMIYLIDRPVESVLDPIQST